MTRPHPSFSLLTAPKLAAAGLVLALLAACAAPAAGPETAVAPRTETQQWEDRVHIDSRPDEVQLAVHAEGLSVAQTQALDGLLGRLNKVVKAPAGANAGRAYQGPVGYVIE